MKNQEIMIVMQTNVALIHVTDAAIKTCETVCNQNIKLCNNDNNFNDTDKKYVNSDSCNLLDMLIALMKMQDKLQLNAKTRIKKLLKNELKRKKNILYLKFFIKKSILMHHNKKT